MTTTWLAKGGYWTAYGREKVPHGAPIPEEEWPPVVGTYKPGPTTTGPRPFLEDGVTPRVLTRYDGDFRITSTSPPCENLDIYGRIIVTSTAPVGSTVENCIIRGPGPISVWSSGWTAAITATSNSLRGLVVTDSRIDLTGRENVWCDGIREGDVTLRRVEITRTNDGVSFISRAGNVLVEACWIHDGYYIEWVKGTAGWPTQSDARSHGDAFQFHRGKNYTIRGCNIGGTRKPGAYHQAPYTTVDPVMVAYKDSGEDYENSCFMIKQESSTEEIDRLDNILIELNWLTGGASGINFSYDRGNPLGGVQVINNRFIRSTWDAENIAVTGRSHIYMIRDTAITATITGNVFDDTGLPVPITKGVTN